MTPSGISALDTLLPLSLQLADEMNINLLTVLSFITYQPAQILGIHAGSIAADCVADVCVFDPHRSWTLSENNMHSSGRNSPFIDMVFRGQVTYTLINGKVVYTQC